MCILCEDVSNRDEKKEEKTSKRKKKGGQRKRRRGEETRRRSGGGGCVCVCGEGVGGVTCDERNVCQMSMLQNESLFDCAMGVGRGALLPLVLLLSCTIESLRGVVIPFQLLLGCEWCCSCDLLVAKS